MNAKQATKKMDRYMLVKQIADLQFVNEMNKADIIDYNRCIDYMIAGGSPCEFCEDYEKDCDHPDCRDAGKGCADWMIRMKSPEEVFAGGSEKKSDSVQSENNLPS